MKKTLSMLLVVSMLASMAVSTVAEDPAPALSGEAPASSEEASVPSKESGAVVSDGEAAAPAQQGQSEVDSGVDVTPAMRTVSETDAALPAAMAQDLTFDKMAKIVKDKTGSPTGHIIKLTPTDSDALNSLAQKVEEAAKGGKITVKGQGTESDPIVLSARVEKGTLILETKNFLQADKAYTITFSEELVDEAGKHKLKTIEFTTPDKKTITLSNPRVIKNSTNKKYGIVEFDVENMTEEDQAWLDYRLTALSTFVDVKDAATGSSVGGVGRLSVHNSKFEVWLGDEKEFELGKTYKVDFTGLNAEDSTLLYALNENTYDVTFTEEAASVTFGEQKNSINVNDTQEKVKLADITVKNQLNQDILSDLTYDVTATKDGADVTRQGYFTADKNGLKIWNPTPAGKYKITVKVTKDGQAHPATATFDLTVTGQSNVKFEKIFVDTHALENPVTKAPVGKTLAVLKAQDSGGNTYIGDVTYEVISAKLNGSGDHKGSFKVKGDELKVEKALTEKGTYVVTVKGTSADGGQGGTLTFNFDPDYNVTLDGFSMTSTNASFAVSDSKNKEGTSLSTLSATGTDSQPYENVLYAVTKVMRGNEPVDMKMFKVEGKQLMLAQKLQPGVYNITVTATDKATKKGTKESSFTLTVNEDKGSSGGSSSNNGGSSSNKEHHSSSHDRDSETRRSSVSRAEKTSANVNKDGTVNTNKVAAKIKEMLNSENKNASVLVENAKTVSSATLRDMAQAAAKKGGQATLMADTVVKGVTEGRLYLDAQKAANLKGEIKLGISTSSKAAQSVEKIFHKYFSNNLEVVTLSHSGSFGMPVRAAVKADLSGMDKNALKFYRYDRATNTYNAMRNVNYTIDSHGFVHFTTNMGGDIIITSGALA